MILYTSRPSQKSLLFIAIIIFYFMSFCSISGTSCQTPICKRFLKIIVIYTNLCSDRTIGQAFIQSIPSCVVHLLECIDHKNFSFPSLSEALSLPFVNHLISILKKAEMQLLLSISVSICEEPSGTIFITTAKK